MSAQQRNTMGMLTGAGSVVLRSMLNILIVPIFIAKLGLDVFGLYMVLLAFLEVATFLDLGATSAIVTLLSGEKDDLGRRSILKVGHVLFIVLSALFLVCGLVWRGQFCELFHITPALQPLATASFLLVILESTLALYSYYCHTVLLAHCAQQWTNLADSMSGLLTNLVGLAALLAGYGLVELMMIRLVSASLRLLLMMIQTARLEPTAFRPGVPIRKESCLAVARMSGHSMMINFSIIISHKIDDLVIAHFLPLSAVGIYEIVFRFLGITLQVGLKLSEGNYALFSQLAVAKQKLEARGMFLRKSAMLSMVAGLILVLITAFYPELFHMFSAGKISLSQTLPVLAIALPCVLSGVMQMPANAWLFTWGHQRFLTVSSLLAALSNLVLSIVLVQVWGIAGVALGTLIPQLIQHQVGLIGKTRHELGISLMEYLQAVYMKTLWPLLAAGGWMLLWRPALPYALFQLPAMALIAGSAALIGALLWLRFSAGAEEKTGLQQLGNRIFRRNLNPFRDTRQPVPCDVKSDHAV